MNFLMLSWTIVWWVTSYTHESSSAAEGSSPWSSRYAGSYVASPASSSVTLIWRRSTARIVPSWMGSSYVLPVRLSVTDRVLFDTRIVLGNGSRKITTDGPQTGTDGR